MKIRIPEDVVFRELGGEAVILNLRTGNYFGLDEVGTRMWALLAEHGDEKRVCEAILEEFDASASDVSRDLDALLTELFSHGLITRE